MSKIFIDVRWYDRSLLAATGKVVVWESTFCSIGDYIDFVTRENIFEFKHSTKVRRFSEDSIAW